MPLIFVCHGMCTYSPGWQQRMTIKLDDYYLLISVSESVVMIDYQVSSPHVCVIGFIFFLLTEFCTSSA